MYIFIYCIYCGDRDHLRISQTSVGSLPLGAPKTDPEF